MVANRILICLIIIFALVFARANVYGQLTEIGEGIMQPFYTDNITQKLVDDVIDSVLKTAHLSRDSMWLAMDTLKGDTMCSPNRPFAIVHGISKANMHEVGFHYAGKLIIRHFESSRSVLNSSTGYEDGFITVSGDGILCLEPAMIPSQKFLFLKSIRFKTTYGDTLPVIPEPKSFWDSTAKPILVTLGAVAVIALFFLVRG